MPEMTRNWIIPATDYCPEFELKIHEPPLTGDNLGFKTWGTAFAMAKQLDWLGVDYLSHTLKSDQEFKVLELGSGTGLVGIAAAAIWRCAVTLTDLPEICPNLAANIEDNRLFICGRGGNAAAEKLDWRQGQADPVRYEVSISILVIGMHFQSAALLFFEPC